MKLIPATGELLEEILDLTFPIWNEGLTREAYGRWNAAQLRTTWGAAHLQRLALVDESGRLLSTAKRYRFRARLGGRAMDMCGIGAVFTPPDRRGRGYATSIIERLIDEERARGAQLAALFSEIGTRFYERIGFRAAAIDEVTVDVKPSAGAPAMLVRAGHESDLPAIVAMYADRAATALFALERDTALVQYSLAKKRLLAGLGPMGMRQVEFHVAEEGASAVAYAIISTNANGWTLDECGDRDPAGARAGALLQVLVAREPSRRPPLIRAWWPRAFPVPPQIAIRNRASSGDVLMLRALAPGLQLPSTAQDVFFWRGDFF